MASASVVLPACLFVLSVAAGFVPLIPLEPAAFSHAAAPFLVSLT